MKRYLNNVREKGVKLAALRESFLQGEPRAGEMIRAVAHDLHGSGAAFGYPELSLAGKGVEYASPDTLPDYLATLIRQIDHICTTKPAPDPQRPAESAGKLSVLVAESNTINASIIGNRIRKLPEVAECAVVNSAVEACDRLVGGNVDLLILDLVLPDADGREILRDIRKVLGVEIPTLVMSGVSNDLLYMECMKLGATSYLTKPFDTDALVQETAKLVRLRRLQLQTPKADTRSTVPAAEQPRRAQSLEGRHILIADDDALQADLISRQLVGQGAQVTHCRDGQETLDFLKEHPVSIVILDVRMPLVDGFRVLETIRGDLGLTGLPVIMLTAMGSEEDVIRGYDLGADDYILKPYSQAQLIGRIKGLLKQADGKS